MPRCMPMEGINSGVYEYILTASHQLDKTEFGLVNQTTVWLFTDIFLNCISHLQKSKYCPILAGIENIEVQGLTVSFLNLTFASSITTYSFLLPISDIWFVSILAA